MRIEQLRYYVEAVNRKSINKAAQALYISQSTISDALKKLEDEVGVQLLKRDHAGISMTLAGESLYQAAADVLARMQQFEEEMAVFKLSSSAGLPSKVELSVTPEMLEQIMPKCLAQWRKQFPELVILCRSGDFMSGLVDMADGRVDAALLMLYDDLLQHEEVATFLTAHRLRAEILQKSKAILCVSADSKLAKRKRITIKEALKQPLSVYNTNLDPVWHKKCFERYGEVQIAYVSGSYVLCDKYVAMNPAAVGFTSELMLRHRDLSKESGNILLELKDDFYYDVIWVTREDETAQYAFMKNLLRSILGEKT